MKNFLKIKGLFIGIAIVFYCMASYAEQNCEVVINKSGGKVIKSGTQAGEIGYASATKDETDETINGVRWYYCNIQCHGRGVNPCPPQTGSCSPLIPDISDAIIATLHTAIDMGETAGMFDIEGFLCTWTDGEKNEDEDENGVFIYSYKLTIKENTSVTHVDMSIQLFPNPAHDHIAVRFSMPIDAMMNVKIIDVAGNDYWHSDIHVLGDELHINDISFLLPGIYYVICTNKDNEEVRAYANFLKQ